MKTCWFWIIAVALLASAGVVGVALMSSCGEGPAGGRESGGGGEGAGAF